MHNDRYRNEIAKLIAKSSGWMVEETPILNKPLSKNEIVDLVRKDCARGVDGLPVMHSVPTRITKKIKL
jgi:hypothetical protein